MTNEPDDLARAEADLLEWARIDRDRDARVRRARALGMSKYKINALTGISRVTIDRILDKKPTR